MSGAKRSINNLLLVAFFDAIPALVLAFVVLIDFNSKLPYVTKEFLIFYRNSRESAKW
jgi:hypothetical protein